MSANDQPAPNNGVSQFPSLPEVPNDVKARVLRHSGMPDNNERLGLLGASILPLVVTEWYMERHPDANPGAITIQRSKRVDKKVVAKWSAFYGLPDQLQCAANEQTVRASTPARCQVFYAYIGAIRQNVDEDGEEREYGWIQVNAFLRQLLDADEILTQG